MGETRITINELIAQMLKAARLAGYTERAVDCDFQPRLRTLEYYRKTGNKAQEEKLYKMLKHILDNSKDLLDEESYKYYYNEIKR